MCGMSERIQFSDFAKLDMRVGKIIGVEAHPKADKLFILKVYFGSEIGERTIVAGLRGHYSADELKNMKATFVVNLEPRVLRGVKSEGMILAASNNDKSLVKILIVDGELEEGSRVS